MSEWNGVMSEGRRPPPLDYGKRDRRSLLWSWVILALIALALLGYWAAAIYVNSYGT